MASWQARALVWLLRWRVKRKLRGEQDFAAARRTLNTPAPYDPRGVSIAEATLGGRPADLVAPAPPRPDAPALLYLHGGGYFACSPRTHRVLTTELARAGLRVFAPDYRLAPEHPFPAAVEDAVSAYQALLAQGEPACRITLAGDSAGGGLAAALLVALKQRGIPLPAGAALFSPWTDLAATGASLVTNTRRDAMFHGDGVGKSAGLYLGAADARDPLASPLYADWSGMPPLLIHVGSWEVLLDDSLRLAERARAAGVTVDLRTWPVVPHVFQLFHKHLPEGRESVRLAAAFLRARVSAGRQSESRPASG